MSGLADRPVERAAAGPQPGPGEAAATGEPDGGRRSRGRTWLGVVIGVVVVSGALVAVLYDRKDDDESTDGSPGRSGPGDATEWTYEWPASYAGPVWITVDAVDATPRTITIRWGPWERRIVHETSELVTYEFSKNPGETVPTFVHVEPGAEVTFGSGTPPADAVDVNPGWTRASVGSQP